jgi:hypothetical protein
MAKPINIEAQRVCKILDDFINKCEVVSYMTAELFQNILAQDYDLENYFGHELANLLLFHAQHEKSFKEIIPLEDEQQTDEHRYVFEKMQKTTSKLVRILMKDDEVLLKLRRFDDHKNTDMADFLNHVNKLRDLWKSKLSTSLEEQNGKDEVVEELTTKNKQLRRRLKEKEDAYAKFKQQTDEKREQLENERSKLTTERSSEAMAKEKERERIKNQSKENQEGNKKNHQQRMKDLTEKRNTLSINLKTYKTENAKEEEKLRKEFGRAEDNCDNGIKTYDKEMNTLHETFDNLKDQYVKVQENLANIETIYRAQMEEKKRKLEEEMKRKRLEQEREQQLNTLNKAAEWIQAHYRGNQDRRTYNKKGKGKKKKKKS